MLLIRNKAGMAIQRHLYHNGIKNTKETFDLKKYLSIHETVITEKHDASN